MLGSTDVQYAAELRKDAHRTAERERLIRQVTGSAPLTQQYQRWAARLGARLVTWGTRLQERYADALATPQVAQVRR